MACILSVILFYLMLYHKYFCPYKYFLETYFFNGVIIFHHHLPASLTVFLLVEWLEGFQILYKDYSDISL